MTTLASSRGGGIGSGAHPFAGFLREHVLPAWQDLGDVRVLIMLWNQRDNERLGRLLGQDLRRLGY